MSPMPTAVRSFDPYGPARDLKSRHPGWSVQLISDLPEDVGEIFLPSRRLVLISRSIHDLDPVYAYAHIVAHLDLHEIGGPFTQRQEEEARMVAEIRLDRDDTCPMAHPDFR